MPSAPALCVIHVLGTDYLRTSSSDPTLFEIRLTFSASCLDEDSQLVAYQVDSEGLPSTYSYESSVALEGDETVSSKHDKLTAAALAGFGIGSIPVLFV